MDIKELEQKVRELRYELIFKDTQLHTYKEKASSENIDKINQLNSETQKIRAELTNLIIELRKLKFAYLVVYEVTTKNIWTHEMETDRFNHTMFLDIDVNVNLPTSDGLWNFEDSDVVNLIEAIYTQLRNSYDEVRIVRVKRIK